MIFFIRGGKFFYRMFMQSKTNNIALFFIGTLLLADITMAESVKAPEAVVAVPSPAANAVKLPISSGSAETLPPNVVELPAKDDGSVERGQVFSQALKSMLMASSNNPNIIKLPAIKAALSKPELYVKQFNYVSKGSNANKPTLFLRINFNPQAIDKLLQRISKVVSDSGAGAAKTVAVSSKPSALIWLAKDIGTGRMLVDEGVDESLVYVIRKKAEELSWPVVLPLDLQDISDVKAQDVCHFKVEGLKKASLRYGTSVIIVGCIKPALLGKTWSSQWLLLQGTKSDRFSFSGESAEGVVVQALQILANSIANVVTKVSGQDTRVVLRIANVNGLDQYHEVARYLHDFSKVITQIDLVNISATEVELAVNAIGGQQALLADLNKQNKIVPNPDVVASPPGIDLDYKWVTLEKENEQPQTASTQPVS